MKKHLYYSIYFQRQHALTDMFLGFFFSICSWPRLVLEVFTRRNMGERYFSFSAVLFVFLLLLSPLLRFVLASMGGPYAARGNDFPYGFIAFAGIFLYFGIQRRNEIKRLPSVFDFKRFSLSTGIPVRIPYSHPVLNWLQANPRRIETVLEPSLFFLLGLVLVALKQSVGLVLVVCSIIYALSYRAAHRRGDNLVMDQIDNMICAEEFNASFSEEKDPSETRGFYPYGRRPADLDFRRRVAESFAEEDEPTIAL